MDTPQWPHGRWCILFILVCHFLLSSTIWAEGTEGEEFSEALLLKPLPDRKVLASFHFETRAPPSVVNGKHHNVFPKAVAQLVKKFNIHEMELSFTQGRWNYGKWGAAETMSSILSKPTGVELWAVFDTAVSDVDATWKNLSHALSGLFCASINFLESSTAYSAPQWGFRNNSGNLRYGALPREAVCTENLTPWLKLLPCRDKAGIASILDRPSIYKSFYHSQRLRLLSSESEGMMVEQMLSVVLQPSERKSALDLLGDSMLQPNWSISSLFRKKVTGPCVVAKSSRVFIELDKGLVSELQNLGPEESWSNSMLKVFPAPDIITRKTNFLDSHVQPIIYEYNAHRYSSSNPLDPGISWLLPLPWSCSKAPFHASRFLMGSGNERGSIAISLQAVQPTLLHQGKEACKVPVVIFQIVPWYVKAYYHTLQIFIDGEVHSFSDIVEKIQVFPSEDKLSPGTMELLLRLPCGTKSAILGIDFDKGFLHIDEYPPDANQGFDIPAAVVSFPDVHLSTRFLKLNESEQNPASSLQERSIVKLYTEVLLVPLTTPDFSMPYNVITFTCTVLALYFGSLLNVLRRRVREEERLLNKESSKRGLIPLLLSKLSGKLRGTNSEASSSSTRSSFLSSKILLKVVLVAVAAVIWHYFLSDA